LIQLHNPVAETRRPDRGWISVEDALVALQAFQKLRREGKIRHWGINGLGDTDALHRAIASNKAATIQCCFNLLNPTAGFQVPYDFPFQDYRCLIDSAAARQMGVIAIRVLAGGALTGSTRRHPNAAQQVDPIATGRDFTEDVARARRFDFLVDDGYVGSLPEAAVRFALGKAEVSTVLVGFSDAEQLEQAIEAAGKGPLPAEALTRVREHWMD
jgi:aryl-alcohol dehydrogenase-like predicted oxidoreductase